MNKVYIAGRISGYPKYQEHFAEAEKRLSEEGNIVINPALLPGGLEQAEYMSICIPMLYVCDEIYLLDGWENSVGANIEHDIAKQSGINMRYEDGESVVNE